MSAMEYSGPERRRGGPDRRNVGEITRILIVDDHALFRVGIANILGREPDFEVVGEADDSRSAVDRAIETSPNVILMDLSLPAPGGIETTQRIKRELPSTAIIVLAVSEDEDALFDAIKAGAAAFILKDVGPDDLVTIDGIQDFPLQYPGLSRREVFESVEEFYRRFYFRPAPIARMLGEMVTDGHQRKRRLAEGKEFFQFMRQRKRNATAEQAAAA